MEAEYLNFYENIGEAHYRLLTTVVMYENAPVRVIAITDHKKDKIFRAYLWPIIGDGTKTNKYYPVSVDSYPVGSADQGAYLDAFMEQFPQGPLMRKHLNSPGFNKFRPFSLGMLNSEGDSAYFMEREPVRRREQGLIRQAIIQSYVSCTVDNKSFRFQGAITGKEWHDCILGTHPSIGECWENLSNPEIANNSAAFNRNFALVRGPLGFIFLAYKKDVVGLVSLETSRFNVQLGKQFKHLREVAEETRAFERIIIQN